MLSRHVHGFGTRSYWRLPHLSTHWQQVLFLWLLDLGTYWRLPHLSTLWQQVLFLLRLLPCLLLTLLLLFLPLLLDGAKPGVPRHPSRDVRSLGLLVHRTGIPRSPVAARPITYGDRVPLDPRTGGLGGSLLLLGVRCLDPFGDEGADSPARGRGGVFSVPVGGRGSGEPKKRKTKVSCHDGQRKNDTIPITMGISY